MKRKRIRISIKRSEGYDTFNAHVLRESTTGYFAVHDGNSHGEWFARSSRNVNCKELEQD